MAQISPTNRGHTELRGRPLPPMYQERETLLLVGLINPEISGSSAGTVTTQPGHLDCSTTFGSTAPANGRGWAARTWSTNRGRTGLWESLPPATFPVHDRVLLL